MSPAADDRCDHCGDGSAGGLTRWATHEVVRPARHYQTSLRPPAPAASRTVRATYPEPAPTPTLRNAYAKHEYRLCPSCYAAAVREAERTLAGQRRGMAFVAALGAIGFAWIVVTSFLHSDLLGRHLNDVKAWVYTAPAPAPYKDPLRGLPSAP